MIFIDSGVQHSIGFVNRHLYFATLHDKTSVTTGSPPVLYPSAEQGILTGFHSGTRPGLPDDIGRYLFLP